MHDDPFRLLLPHPRAIERAPGALALPPGTRLGIEAESAVAPAARARVEDALTAAGFASRAEADEAVSARVSLAVASPTSASEAYSLAIEPDGLRLVGEGAPGLLHAAATLAQLLDAARTAGHLPCALIRDAPAFARRGWMLDVSRDRVPRLETLHRLIDLLAAWKGNELQLYTEHTFAYAGHEEVWRGCDPYTPDEIRALDRHCIERGVRLVPNQNSFGHMHRWLKHARYRDLAEVPEGVEHPFAPTPEPFSLCATDPRSLDFVAALFDELLPCFTSDELNAGLDETFDLGLGRSKAACEARGKGRVYLEYLQGVNALVRARGRRMQFWADVIFEHPELVPEVPKDAIAMLWGYDAKHPFDAQARAVAASGLEFGVCPGTSSWQSLAGRTSNLIANVDAAVRAGMRHGARGVLITDWGDRGHLQPEWASYAGWALASALAWNPEPPNACDPRDPAQLAALLDAHVFQDDAGVLGALALDLGRVGEASGAQSENASPLFLLLLGLDATFPPARVRGLEPAGLERAEAALDAALARLPRARSRRPDAALLDEEFTWVGAMLRFAIRLGRARFAHPGPPSALPPAKGSALAEELGARLAEQRALWPRRSRGGGVERALGALERLRGSWPT